MRRSRHPTDQVVGVVGHHGSVRHFDFERDLHITASLFVHAVYRAVASDGASDIGRVPDRLWNARLHTRESRPHGIDSFRVVALTRRGRALTNNRPTSRSQISVHNPGVKRVW